MANRILSKVMAGFLVLFVVFFFPGWMHAQAATVHLQASNGVMADTQDLGLPAGFNPGGPMLDLNGQPHYLQYASPG